MAECRVCFFFIGARSVFASDVKHTSTISHIRSAIDFCLSVAFRFFKRFVVKHKRFEAKWLELNSSLH